MTKANATEDVVVFHQAGTASWRFSLLCEAPPNDVGFLDQAYPSAIHNLKVKLMLLSHPARIVTHSAEAFGDSWIVNLDIAITGPWLDESEDRVSQMARWLIFESFERLIRKFVTA